MATSLEQGTAPANHDQPPTRISDGVATELLRLLRSLRLHPLHWGANQTVQRTGASRHAGWRCGHRRWLAPVADLGVRQPRSQRSQTGTSPLSSDRMNRIYRMVPILGSARINPVHPVHPVQNPESVFPSGSVCQDWRAGSFPPEAPMSSVELDGPANGCQPARRVALRTPRVAVPPLSPPIGVICEICGPPHSAIPQNLRLRSTSRTGPRSVSRCRPVSRRRVAVQCRTRAWAKCPSPGTSWRGDPRSRRDP